MEINQITEKTIGCVIEVYKRLGPGLSESAYEQCLSHELQNAEFSIIIPAMNITPDLYFMKDV